MPEDNSDAPVGDLERWLTQQVATYLNRRPEEIDQRTSFADHGLDSVYALTFCADIEDHLGITVSDTVLWDYTTIRELADHLAELVAEAGRQGAGTS